MLQQLPECSTQEDKQQARCVPDVSTQKNGMCGTHALRSCVFPQAARITVDPPCLVASLFAPAGRQVANRQVVYSPNWDANTLSVLTSPEVPLLLLHC